ncbi:hypothetical protein L1987_85210 [Smallanthus sonchifolius]|uniref:Uncharacterized protein n=1 Tax=Smallanthus sonchifolius TaxID=185202 RepID=A0ACB8XXI1_9ASTR|nr:hypothetical protein L1987_85210 [Smallanthus sonchifolius]
MKWYLLRVNSCVLLSLGVRMQENSTNPINIRLFIYIKISLPVSSSASHKPLQPPPQSSPAKSEYANSWISSVKSAVGGVCRQQCNTCGILLYAIFQATDPIVATKRARVLR